MNPSQAKNKLAEIPVRGDQQHAAAVRPFQHSIVANTRIKLRNVPRPPRDCRPEAVRQSVCPRSHRPEDSRVLSGTRVHDVRSQGASRETQGRVNTVGGQTGMRFQ